jgi:amidase
VCAWEAYGAQATHFPTRSEEYGEYFRDFLRLGAEVSEAAYVAASRLRAEFNRQFRALLSSVDALVAPSGGVPFALPAEVQYGPMSGFDPYMSNVQLRFTVPADFAGTPTLSLPCGFSEDGLPYTIQLMGSHLRESTLCRIGHAYEEATPWHNRHPNV